MGDDRDNLTLEQDIQVYWNLIEADEIAYLFIFLGLVGNGPPFRLMNEVGSQNSTL